MTKAVYLCTEEAQVFVILLLTFILHLKEDFEDMKISSIMNKRGRTFYRQG